MNQLYTLCLTTILTIYNLRICHATLYTQVNNVKEDHRFVNSKPAIHYLANKEDNRPTNQLKFHNIPKNGLNHHHQTYDEKQTMNNPSKLYTSVDYNVEHDNDVDDGAFNKDQHQQQLHDSFNYGQQEKPSLFKQLQSQHQELSEGYAAFLREPEPYQVVAPPKAESGSSNEHLRQQHYLTAYVTPAPLTNLKMHPNLQHRQQKFINKPQIVSYATGGNEALTKSTTATSIKSLYDVKYLTTNDLQAYDHTNTNLKRQPALVYGQPGSKQYVFAPMRSSMERKLPYSSKTLPYPPSFITFTTPETPYHNYNNYYSNDHKTAYNRIPDLFSSRRSKSLLDSYIPSWQITKMLQRYENSPLQGVPKSGNLHTLALVRPYNTYYKREVNKG